MREARGKSRGLFARGIGMLSEFHVGHPVGASQPVIRCDGATRPRTEWHCRISFYCEQLQSGNSFFRPSPSFLLVVVDERKSGTAPGGWS